MLKLIIVDDEPMVCESMRSMIDWDAIGIEVIATCSNGIDALDVIIDEHPDIVMSDIKMPVMDGIELLKHAKQINPKVEFIFITGFAEFEYARTAMKYGVHHYLIKPCGEKEILEAVSAVAKSVRASKEAFSVAFSNPEFAMQNHLVAKYFGYENIFKDRWAEQTTIEQEKTPYICVELFPFPAEKGADLVKALRHDWVKNYPQIPLHIVSTHTSAQIFFEDNGEFSSDAFERSAKDYMMRYFGEIRNIVFRKYKNLKCLIDALVPYMKATDVVYFYREGQQIPIESSHSLIDSCMLAAEKILTGSDTEKEHARFELSHMLNRSDSLYTLQGIISILIRRIDADRDLNPDLAFHAQLYSDIETLTEAFITWLSTVDEKKKTASEYKDYIQTAISYVEEHISDSSLSLKWISENILFMNVDYVSKQFLKQTGMKFSQYLNKLRIDKAKLMLINAPEMTMNEIAEAIGCGNNPFYFSQLFKKQTGQTPSAFAKVQKKIR